MAKAIAVAENSNELVTRLKSGPQRLGVFLQDVRTEMRKVVTPSRAQVQATTIVVIVTVFVFAAYFGAVDYIVGHLMDLLLKWLAK